MTLIYLVSTAHLETKKDRILEIEYLVYTKNLLHSMQSNRLRTQKSTSFHKVSLKLVPKISYDVKDIANVPPSKPMSKSEHNI